MQGLSLITRQLWLPYLEASGNRKKREMYQCFLHWDKPTPTLPIYLLIFTRAISVAGLKKKRKKKKHSQPSFPDNFITINSSLRLIVSVFPCIVTLIKPLAHWTVFSVPDGFPWLQQWLLFWSAVYLLVPPDWRVVTHSVWTWPHSLLWAQLGAVTIVTTRTPGAGTGDVVWRQAVPVIVCNTCAPVALLTRAESLCLIGVDQSNSAVFVCIVFFFSESEKRHAHFRCLKAFVVLTGSF